MYTEILPNACLSVRARTLQVLVFSIYSVHSQGRIQALFEIGNCFWAHQNQYPNFARSTIDTV